MAMAEAKYMNAIALCLVFMNCLGVTIAELQRFEHPSNSKPDGSLSFLVIGDWGRRGLFNQSQVASQMAKVADDLDIDFVVSTGDNFYSDGLVDENDPNFDESFSRVYTAHSLQKQWYSVLGNHDYRGNVEAQLSPVLRILDFRWLCLRSFIVDADLAEIVFVDTTPFVESYFTDAQGHTYDWRGIKSREAYIQTLLADVDLALRESTAKWKIVVGHHAIRSVGHHGDTAELVNLLLPVLERNDVDFYMNGHDHCLEHIRDTNSGMQFLTSGAGSKAWRGDAKAMNRKDVEFFYDGQGFMSVYLSRAFSQIVFYDVYGETLHKFGVPKLHSHSAT